nr:lipopolysaccharide kinase InaA family protein [Alcanivorax quisquiliarum]
MLDAAGCRIGKVSSRQLAKNLALLLAQVPPIDAEAVLAEGSEAANLPPRHLVRKAQQHRYEVMLKKTERDCTHYQTVAVAGLRGMCVRSAHPQLLALLGSGSDGLTEHGRMLKDGGASTVVALDHLGWVVKRYNLKKRRNQWKVWLGSSRARRSWRAAHFLQYCGVYTPSPVAYLEDRRTGVAWFISAIHRGPLLDSVQEYSQLRTEWCASLTELFILMRMFRWAHGDMKASNIVLCDAKAGLIDLDGWRRFRSQRRANRAIDRDKARLLRNWAESKALREKMIECLN